LRTNFWLLTGLLTLSATLSAQTTGSYVRDAEGWLSIENGQIYRVDPAVISARFVAPVFDVQSYLDQLDGDATGLTVIRINRLGTADLALPQGADPLAVVAALSSTGTVHFAEVNTIGSYGVTPNDPQFSSLWHLHNTGQTGGSFDADVDGPEVWDIEDGDPSVIVAILDSGTDHTHPDLNANIWNNAGEVIDGVDNDLNGYIDDVIGWDFDGNDNDPNGVFFHGTAVAGVVGAVGNNGTDIVGLAGGASDGQGCSIMPCNVGSFAPNAAVLDDAIIYAADNGARVITMSLTVGTATAITNAIAYADGLGVFVDCAAGNNGGSVTYPANLPTVMAVASTNHFDDKSGFSNPGPEVEVAAPGENILMTNLGGGLTTQSGTSFSAPHVAALAGLMFSANPAISNADVRAIMRSTADDVGAPGFDTGTGDGRINAFQAVAAVLDGFVPGVYVLYGSGLAGSGGTTPIIGTIGGTPGIGELGFAVTVRQAAPSSTAYLLVSVAQSSLPFKGGVLLADVIGPHLEVVATTSAQGGAAIALPVPNDQALLGVSFYCQWLIQDAGATAGWAMSSGLELGIGTF
jgi:subtilisin family serine protease